MQFPEGSQLLHGVQSGEGGEPLSDWREGGVQGDGGGALPVLHVLRGLPHLLDVRAPDRQAHGMDLQLLQEQT